MRLKAFCRRASTQLYNGLLLQVIHKMGPIILACLAASGILLWVTSHHPVFGDNILIAYAILYFVLYYPIKGVMRMVFIELDHPVKKDTKGAD